MKDRILLILLTVICVLLICGNCSDSKSDENNKINNIAEPTYVAIKTDEKTIIDEPKYVEVEPEIEVVKVVNEPIVEVDNPIYTEAELDLLSRVVYAEAGSDWLTDEHQMAVASVILNRVRDDRFPNSIRDVIYQTGQYGCVNNGMINNAPNQRAIDNVKYVLDNGVTIPDNVVWQAQFKQGNGVWKNIQGHYFCY